MPLPERMQLADKRPLRRRMMAAMGQQDCGQCGFNCEDYANAIALKQEERLNLCVPGGKDTTRTLKTLFAELGAAPAPVKAPAIAEARSEQPAAASAKGGASRDRPVEIAFASRTRLNKPGSNKETWHIDLDLADSGLAYSPGDSLGIFPRNDPALVDAVIAAVGMPADFPIADRTLRDTLTDTTSPVPVARHAVQADLSLSAASGGRRQRRSPPAAIPTATPRIWTWWRRWRNFPVSGLIPKLSSRRSIRCSRGFIRLRHRRGARPARWR